MVSVYSPDTCKCVIIFKPQDGTVLENYTKSNGKIINTKKCKGHEEIELQELYQFVLNENQACNEFYKNWALENFTDEKNAESSSIIEEYKKVFAEVPTMELISFKSFEESVKEFRG